MYNVKEVLKNPTLFTIVADKTFDAVDTDGSGKISEDELYIILCTIATDLDYEKPTKDELNVILKKHDKDKSGVIEREEFYPLFRNILEVIDTS
jgi:Ca2+-binding EF-hand superfamily protein